MWIPGALELVLLAIAVAASAWVQPWRLLAHDSRYQLMAPLLASLLGLAALWWWPGALLSPLLGLFGAQLVLLSLGWPLAVLMYAAAGVFAWLAGAGGPAAAQAAFWQGLLPATLALALGALLRRAWRPNLPSFLFGRAFLIPLACTWAAALAANGLLERHAGLGPHAGAALLLFALLDAMLTGFVATLLVMYHPRTLATWSEALYMGQEGRAAVREGSTSPGP